MAMMPRSCSSGGARRSRARGARARGTASAGGLGPMCRVRQMASAAGQRLSRHIIGRWKCGDIGVACSKVACSLGITRATKGGRLRSPSFLGGCDHGDVLLQALPPPRSMTWQDMAPMFVKALRKQRSSLVLRPSCGTRRRGMQRSSGARRLRPRPEAQGCPAGRCGPELGR